MTIGSFPLPFAARFRSLPGLAPEVCAVPLERPSSEGRTGPYCFRMRILSSGERVSMSMILGDAGGDGDGDGDHVPLVEANLGDSGSIRAILVQGSETETSQKSSAPADPSCLGPSPLAHSHGAPFAFRDGRHLPSATLEAGYQRPTLPERLAGSGQSRGGRQHEPATDVTSLNKVSTYCRSVRKPESR